MASRFPVTCYRSGGVGHKKYQCREIRCYCCQRFGHKAIDCSHNRRRTQRSSRNHVSGTRENRSAAPERTAEEGDAEVSRRNNEAQATTWSPTSVNLFFVRYPTIGKQPWLGPNFCLPAHSSSARSSLTSESSDPQSLPAVHAMTKDMFSNIRSMEAVKRAAETIFKGIGAVDKEPVQILINKQFLDFQEKKNPGLLSVPKDELCLQRGDFDIIILHPALGYIHLEVKAFGDAQDHFGDQEKLLELVRVLQEKTVDKLQKGRRVLQYLQPAQQKVNIVNTVALPNVSRADLKRALDHKPELRKALTECISEETLDQVAVEDLCLCSDDLPPKDSVVDEADPTVMNAFNKWWSAITAICTKTKCSPENYRCILASFFNNEEVKNLPEYVHDMGEKCEDLQLDEQQAKVVDSEEQ